MSDRARHWRTAFSMQIPRGMLLCTLTLICLGGVTMAAMAASSVEAPSPFASALIASGPSPQMPKAAAAVYDWLVGDWDVEVYDYEPDGSKRESRGEWHFSWVLEGRAI